MVGENDSKVICNCVSYYIHTITTQCFGDIVNIKGCVNVTKSRLQPSRVV